VYFYLSNFLHPPHQGIAQSHHIEHMLVYIRHFGGNNKMVMGTKLENWTEEKLNQQETKLGNMLPIITEITK